MRSGQVVKLSERLRTVADLAGDNISSLADVGCDHGWLGISLLLEERATHVIGMDLREGPLSHARENALGSGLGSDRFETRLSDGLDRLAPGEADVIVMAGMGGVLMCGLLTRGIEVARAAKRLVLSPQSHIEEVRALLAAEGFVITDERMCRESGKYYTVMQVNPGSAAYALKDEELFFGPVLIKKREPLFLEYVAGMRDKAKKRLSEIAGGNEERKGLTKDAGIKPGAAREDGNISVAPGIKSGTAHEDGYDPEVYFGRILASANKVLQ
ncbi:MAG: SAM-dependent methyltransferase [Lachnospiraceae bacterium]|nr:SAM-dependent methyltransferase [Lachnospiraceae bacterium]